MVFKCINNSIKPSSCDVTLNIYRKLLYNCQKASYCYIIFFILLIYSMSY